MKQGKRFGIAIVVLGLALSLGWASPAMASYNHLNDMDSGVFRALHPDALGTKLDSCTLCHTGGSKTSGGRTTNYGSCQWCHTTYGYEAPHGDILSTLNVYGSAYLLAGRNTAALTAIAAADSDADGYTNAEEIAAGRFPGDAGDDPSKMQASYRIYSMAQLRAMAVKRQFMAMNASKSDDSYTEYAGVTMEELLRNAGVLPSATGISVYAPDGFSVYHPLDPPTSTVAGLYPVRWTYPEGTFLYDPIADMAMNPAGWINYTSPGRVGRVSGSPIVVEGGLKLLLAYERDGAPLVRGVLSSSNKLDGEGPYRVVPPQVVPGPLDQRSSATSSTLVWPYDSALDHNAGFSSRSATIIRVEPLPAGTTDVNVFEAGWDLLDEDKVVVYGALKPMSTSASLKASVTSVRRGHYVTLTAKLTSVGGDTFSNTYVRFESMMSGAGHYHLRKNVKVSANGTATYRYKVLTKGKRYHRVKFLGDASHARTPVRHGLRMYVK